MTASERAPIVKRLVIVANARLETEKPRITWVGNAG